MNSIKIKLFIILSGCVHLLNAQGLIPKHDVDSYHHFILTDSTFSGSNHHESYQEITQLIGNDRKNPRLYFQRALLEKAAGLFHKAYDDLIKAQGLADTQAVSKDFVDSLATEKIILLPLVQYTRTTIAEFDKFLLNHQKNKKVLFYKALTMYCFTSGNDKGRYKQSISFFEDYLKEDPQSPEAHAFIALCYIDLKDYLMSVKHFDKAIEYENDYIFAYTHRGLVRMKLKQRDFACADFKTAERLSPSRETSWLTKKYCNNKSGLK